MKALLAAALALVAAPVPAQMPRYELRPIPAGTLTGEIPLWPAGSLPKGAVPESWNRVTAQLPDGSSVDNRMIRNVSLPTMTPVLPDPAKATGAAVVVAPGGAFMALSIDDEGLKVAHWLADHGIAAFVLKYRLNPTPADNAGFEAAIGKRMADSIKLGGAAPGVGEPRAYQDALQALRLVRAGGAKWHVDPARVGIIGFSAGAMTALQSVLTGTPETRPAFVGYVYGPMVAVEVPERAPPLFAALALDDPLFGRQGFGIVDAWRRAGSGVELHAYQRGDHGFGTGRPGTTTTLVMEEFRLWLDSNGFLREARS